MRQLLRRASIALIVGAGVALIFFLTDVLERMVAALLDRLGAAWTLGIVAGAIVVLGLIWLRYGGTGVLRRWGVVLVPARTDEDTAGPDSGSDPEPRARLVEPRR